MNCQECRDLLDAYLDNELDAAGVRAVQQHLRECSDCRAALAELRDLQTILRRPEMRYQAPVGLRDNITAALARESAEHLIPSRSSRKVIPLFVVLAAAAALVIVAGLTWFGIGQLFSPSPQKQLVAELVQSHRRSLSADHLVDLTSSEQAALKSWFAAKAGFTPPVWELGQKDFELVGGRLDYVKERRAAVLVYRQDNHVINVFMWPTTNRSELEGEASSQEGWQLMHWRRNGIACWAVTDASPEVLKAFYERVDEESEKG